MWYHTEVGTTEYGLQYTESLKSIFSLESQLRTAKCVWTNELPCEVQHKVSNLKYSRENLQSLSEENNFDACSDAEKVVKFLFHSSKGIFQSSIFHLVFRIFYLVFISFKRGQEWFKNYWFRKKLRRVKNDTIVSPSERFYLENTISNVVKRLFLEKQYIHHHAEGLVGFHIRWRINTSASHRLVFRQYKHVVLEFYRRCFSASLSAWDQKAPSFNSRLTHKKNPY